ncbi:hypothetical protein KC347_g305 [Hortaea werneckii]|nr:hypothetical protein KC347_g305 [Hortaea werneckii]
MLAVPREQVLLLEVRHFDMPVCPFVAKAPETDQKTCDTSTWRCVQMAAESPIGASSQRFLKTLDEKVCHVVIEAAGAANPSCHTSGHYQCGQYCVRPRPRKRVRISVAPEMLSLFFLGRLLLGPFRSRNRTRWFELVLTLSEQELSMP